MISKLLRVFHSWNTKVFHMGNKCCDEEKYSLVGLGEMRCADVTFGWRNTNHFAKNCLFDSPGDPFATRAALTFYVKFDLSIEMQENTKQLEHATHIWNGKCVGQTCMLLDTCLYKICFSYPEKYIFPNSHIFVKFSFPNFKTDLSTFDKLVTKTNSAGIMFDCLNSESGSSILEMTQFRHRKRVRVLRSSDFTLHNACMMSQASRQSSRFQCRRQSFFKLSKTTTERISLHRKRQRFLWFMHAKRTLCTLRVTRASDVIWWNICRFPDVSSIFDGSPLLSKELRNLWCPTIFHSSASTITW